MYKTITVFFYEQCNINQNKSDIEESNWEVFKAAKKFSPNLGTAKFY